MTSGCSNSTASSQVAAASQAGMEPSAKWLAWFGWQKASLSSLEIQIAAQERQAALYGTLPWPLFLSWDKPEEMDKGFSAPTKKFPGTSVSPREVKCKH